MEYLDNKASWEEFFTKELEALQEKMPTFDVESLSKSKLRLSLESKILDWKKYEEWAIETYGCSSIKENLPETTLKSYSVSAQQAFTLYSSYNFWSQDLVPMFIWENQLIVFGLQYSPALVKIPNHIFVLAPPRILSYFANLLIGNKPSMSSFDDLNEMFGDSPVMDGLSEDVQPISIDFKDLGSDAVTNVVPRPRKAYGTKQAETEIWDLVGERYEEYCDESRKQFDAFLILRLNFDLTQIFKMDPDLEKKNINEKLFEYSTTRDEAFKNVMKDGRSVTTSASELGLELLSYKNICITPIMRSRAIVGFFMGFKNEQISVDDTALLEELSKETAQAS
ncbi:MAG: hypothetical protein K0R29_304 [Pseudobdellovibrio sp.]|jgi:hypothetical protein|nr:hypothetical protein [Pseudobdellovibrio sp.]